MKPPQISDVISAIFLQRPWSFEEIKEGLQRAAPPYMSKKRRFALFATFPKSAVCQGFMEGMHSSAPRCAAGGIVHSPPRKGRMEEAIALLILEVFGKYFQKPLDESK